MSFHELTLRCVFFKYLYFFPAMPPKKPSKSAPSKKGRVEAPPTQTHSLTSSSDSDATQPVVEKEKPKKKRAWECRRTTNFTLNQEDDIVGWFQNQPHLWLRSHHDYKNDARKRATIERKAVELKVAPENLKVCRIFFGINEMLTFCLCQFLHRYT